MALPIKYFLISLAFFSLFSFTAVGQDFSVAKDRAVVYQSFGNSVGEIVLVLEANKKFQLWYKSYADGKNYRLKGKWGKRGDNIRLVFQGKKANFEQLFPESRRTKNFKIINENTVQFSAKDNGLFIWGAFCFKQ